MVKVNTIQVQGIDISIYTDGERDYISLTDIIKAKDGEFFISDWLRNANTLEYLGAWEAMHNPNFNYGEFAIIRSNSGVNSYKISTKEWTEKTNAIGLKAKTGRYGGTYAHKDIAFHFCMWISPTFQLYVVKEFQRLKEIESNQLEQEWEVKRIVAKANYALHTDAIKEYIVPNEPIEERLIYSTEADMINVALFGCTASQWRHANPSLALSGRNIRDYASISELAVLSNLESLNSILIKQNLSREHRFDTLKQVASEQLKGLETNNSIRAIKRTHKGVLYEAQKNNKEE